MYLVGHVVCLYKAHFIALVLSPDVCLYKAHFIALVLSPVVCLYKAHFIALVLSPVVCLYKAHFIALLLLQDASLRWVGGKSQASSLPNSAVVPYRDPSQQSFAPLESFLSSREVFSATAIALHWDMSFKLIGFRAQGLAFRA